MNESERKQQFLQHKGKHGSSKKNYTDKLKSTGRKVSYAAVFTDTTRRGALPEEAFIYTAEMTAIKAVMKEIKERECDILTELHNQGKQLTLCKVPAHIGIKENVEAGRHKDTTGKEL